jgi:hypothetical protein
MYKQDIGTLNCITTTPPKEKFESYDALSLRKGACLATLCTSSVIVRSSYLVMSHDRPHSSDIDISYLLK